MLTKLFHESLTGTQFLRQLQHDLDNCVQLQFLIAYISNTGIQAIGKHRLIEALSQKGSYGITSLACGFDYNDIISIQDQLGSDVKLKLFVNLVKEPYGEESLSLLHSKVVYLRTRAFNGVPPREIFYVGSHNWTGRALGAVKGKNAEASVRFEMAIGEDNELSSNLKKHLYSAWQLRSCIPALSEHQQNFDEWHQAICPYASRGENGEAIEPVLVLIAVCAKNYFLENALNDILNKAIYLQADSEEDVKEIRSRDQRTLILTWEKVDDLYNNVLPTILYARVSNLIETEKGKGSNTSVDAIAGFHWIIRDMDRSQYGPQSIFISSLGDCEYWSLEKLNDGMKTSIVDGTQRPRAQFLLEVEHIIPPEELKHLGITDVPGLFWKEGEVAFSKNKDVPFDKLDGIETGSDELTQAIKREYKEIFGIEQKLPIFTKHEKATSGLRIVKDKVNRLVLKAKSENQENLHMHYGEIRNKGIRLTPDRVSLLHQESGKLFSARSTQAIKRTTFLYFEGANRFVERLKSWRAQGK